MQKYYELKKNLKWDIFKHAHPKGGHCNVLSPIDL